ncbi:MAG: R3H domain-containing nucleic acid-binding protein [Candidatus Peregrinibacteria bacterium]
MDTEETLKDILEEVLKKLDVDYKKITISEDEKDNFKANIDSENPSLLIGYHGDNIYALQHIVKVIAWRKLQDSKFNILIDVDNYRQRQEESILAIAERKIEFVRKTGKPQRLQPMSPYYRRKVHMLCMSAGYDDIETLSEGDGESRYITIKLK